jgi:amino acid transporter
VSPKRETSSPPEDAEPPAPLVKRLKQAIIGKPRDLTDRSLFHRLALIPILAWVGLGADGLSSSSYGPGEGFLALGKHHHLALVLALMTAVTVTVISAAYSYIIEEFPAGGGGYSVASKLLGPIAGVISGCALLVDYVLTITTSIAAAGDAMFSLVPQHYGDYKLLAEILFIFGLTVLNLRGVRESILTLLPIFALFLITHAVLLVGGLVVGYHDWAGRTAAVGENFARSHSELGWIGVLLLLARAYSMGGGTYTGIEAVSNGMPMMREPRVTLGRRTMLYMAVSLSVTAAGLLVCYFLTDAQFTPGKTMNAVLVEEVGARMHFGQWFSALTLLSEGALLVVAAQTGFLDGPRILANMAVDSWVPRRFAGLSERLTTQNGIVLVGGAALLALVNTRGQVDRLVVMYSVNVFITFSLSMFAMLNFWRRAPKRKGRKRRTYLFACSFALCATILVITVFEKFMGGAWITLLVTGSLVIACILIHRHYRSISEKLAELDRVLDVPPLSPAPRVPPLSPDKPTAAILVGGYSGVGVHTLLSVLRAFPGHFHNFVFLSVGVVDSGVFKGADEIDALREKSEADLKKYVEFAHKNGLPAMSRVGIGTEVASVAEDLCREVADEFPRTVFFAARVVFQQEEWGHRLLHNETAVALQRRLQAQGKTLVVMPVMVRDTA